MNNPKTKLKKTGHCTQPDRHVASLVCGYPLPCPYHTVILSEEHLFEVLSEIEDIENEKTGSQDD